MATELQKQMLINIATSEYTSSNGAEPECTEDTYTWLNVIVQTPQDKGVFTSLKNAGLIFSYGRGQDAEIGLTEKGLEEYKKIDK